MMTMSQHFLLSAAARTLSLKDVYKGGEDKAYVTFCKLRWHQNDGAPTHHRAIEASRAIKLPETGLS